VKNAEYGDMLYVYGFCDGSTTGAVEYHRLFTLHGIPDCSVFFKVFSTLCECGTIPSAHVLPE
jgi:hypothetical protein